jgi:hypothetical protein
MKHSELLSSAIDVKSAVNKIKSNNQIGYIWIAVKTAAGCYLEMGGRNFDEEMGLELKIYVPEYENGLPKEYKLNGSTCQDYAVICYDNGSIIHIEYSHTRETIKNKFKSIKQFVKWADNKDFINQPIRIEYYTKEVLVTKTFSKINF